MHTTYNNGGRAIMWIAAAFSMSEVRRRMDMEFLTASMTTNVRDMRDGEIAFAIRALSQCRALLECFPAGTDLWAAALCKYARRDPLAIEFMQSHVVTA
jgi:hypothetical protein